MAVLVLVATKMSSTVHRRLRLSTVYDHIRQVRGQAGYWLRRTMRVRSATLNVNLLWLQSVASEGSIGAARSKIKDSTAADQGVLYSF